MADTTHAGRMLALVEAALEGRMVDGIESHSIGGVPINLIQADRLMAIRSQYRVEVQREREEMRLQAGLGSRRTIKVRFGGVS